jgi:hypothetical protein
MKHPKGNGKNSIPGSPKSVLVMTKFPEVNSPIDEELRHVIEVVRKCVQDEGFHPRIF